jgi:arylsulfatase A-like enzyme
VIRYDALGTAGAVSDAVVANIDLAPTIAGLTGVSAPGVDGISLEAILRNPSSTLAREGIVLEHLAKRNDVVPTYCGFRTATYSYVRYATSEEELYDLRNDPDQLQNSVTAVDARSMLEVLRRTTRRQCTPPDDGFSWEP